MNRKFVLCAVAAMLVFATEQTTFASVQTVSQGDTMRLGTGHDYRQGSGGEFQMDLDIGTTGSYIDDYTHTFCAEIGTNLQNPGFVSAVSLQTAESGKDMTAGAAKLFRDYADGIGANNNGFGDGSNSDLAGVSFDLAGGTFAFNLDVSSGAARGVRASNGEAVQEALWFMIGWGNSLSSDAQDLVDWYTDSNNVTNDGNFFGVRFANLTVNGDDAQDMFIIIPEPGSMLIWAGSIGLAGFFTRRRRIA